MHTATIRKLLTRLYRLSFIMAFIVLSIVMIAMFFDYLKGSADAAGYSGFINGFVLLCFVAAISKVVRDLFFAPHKDSQ